MSAPSIAPPDTDESVWLSTLFGNAGKARMWRACSRFFLAAFVLALLVHVWNISADLQARRTWPSANGEIVSAEQRDDTNVALRRGSIRGRTRYWVEYEVRFAVPENQCTTGIRYTGPSENPMLCEGNVRTRSTYSTAEVYQWMIHGYYRNEPVKVQYNPSGPEIKIVGESVWLRYNFDQLMLNVLWVIVFGALHAFAQRRLEYFKRHPEAEAVLPQSDTADKYKLTTLDLS